MFFTHHDPWGLITLHFLYNVGTISAKLTTQTHKCTTSQPLFLIWRRDKRWDKITRASGEEATYAQGLVVIRSIWRWLHIYMKGFFMYKETIKSMVFMEWNIIRCNKTQYHFTVHNIHESGQSKQRWCTHMKWLLNNSVGIIKKINRHLPINDSITIVDSTWINSNYRRSHMFVPEMRHQINQCEYEFVNANYDVGHTNGIN